MQIFTVTCSWAADGYGGGPTAYPRSANFNGTSGSSLHNNVTGAAFFNDAGSWNDLILRYNVVGSPQKNGNGSSQDDYVYRGIKPRQG